MFKTLKTSCHKDVVDIAFVREVFVVRERTPVFRSHRFFGDAAALLPDAEKEIEAKNRRNRNKDRRGRAGKSAAA